MFIDASQYYEKTTNQYLLRTEDIDKIISTYRNRIEENKYSRQVDLKEIAENEYNLNIPSRTLSVSNIWLSKAFISLATKSISILSEASKYQCI